MRACIEVIVGSRVSGLRHLGAPTTQNPAFREASPEISAPQFTGARHTTNASFAAEVEARFRCEARDYGASVNDGVLPVLDVERTTLAAFRNGAFDPERTLRRCSTPLLQELRCLERLTRALQ
jgi:hypothetical protein